MKCAPRAGWIFVGFGVAISLLFAIFVLALANSKRRVWGFSGSKRIPWGRDAGGEEGGQSTVREVGWVKGGAAAQLPLKASFPKAVSGYPGRILPASLQLKPPPSSCGMINRHPGASAHTFLELCWSRRIRSWNTSTRLASLFPRAPEGVGRPEEEEESAPPLLGSGGERDEEKDRLRGFPFRWPNPACVRVP